MTALAPRAASAVRAIVLMLALAVPLRAAVAHTRLLQSQPAADAHVAAAPGQLGLLFSRKPILESSRVELMGAGMRPVAVAALRIDPKDARRLIVPITGPMPAGRYTVRWSVAGADGHSVRGTYTFTVDRSSATAEVNASCHAASARDDSRSTYNNIVENCSAYVFHTWRGPVLRAAGRASVHVAHVLCAASAERGPDDGRGIGDGSALRRRIVL
ncbi:MAG: copper resistance protein CopC [Gemmatimonadetes bacterium]|nr:copper resistance protein CopC [Gemmatimonadota bacterium]